MKDKKQLNAMELAFKKAVEDGTKRDKDTIKTALFGNDKVKSVKKNES